MMEHGITLDIHRLCNISFRFSGQAMQIAMNSAQSLICSQIRSSSSANHLPITTSENDISSLNKHNIIPSSHERNSCNVNTTITSKRSLPSGVDGRSQQRKKTGSNLIDRGLPLSQLGFSLWGRKVKCLCKSGYYFRSLSSELVDGSIRAFVMNHTMSSLHPCVSIVWRCRVEESSKGRSILMLFKCPVSGSVGAVSRRHLGIVESQLHGNTSTTSQYII